MLIILMPYLLLLISIKLIILYPFPCFPCSDISLKRCYCEGVELLQVLLHVHPTYPQGSVSSTHTVFVYSGIISDDTDKYIYIHIYIYIYVYAV